MVYAIRLMVQKSCTSWCDEYPIFYIPGGAGFWPSTVFISSFFFKSNCLLGNQEVIKLKVIQQNLQHRGICSLGKKSVAQALRIFRDFWCATNTNSAGTKGLLKETVGVDACWYMLIHVDTTRGCFCFFLLLWTFCVSFCKRVKGHLASDVVACQLCKGGFC